MKYIYLIFLLIIPGLVGIAHAHTIDSVGEYRLEIGWLNEPVVSKEANGIELFISPLEPGVELEDQIFENGVTGLRKDIKIKLSLRNNSIILPLVPDHNLGGKYYAFVTPTVPGFYQANVIGYIHDTAVSLSMHPPKVNERENIEFPEPVDLTLNSLTQNHTLLKSKVNTLEQEITTFNELKSKVNTLEQEITTFNELESKIITLEQQVSKIITLEQQLSDAESTIQSLGYAGVVLGIIGIIIAVVALVRSKK